MAVHEDPDAPVQGDTPGQGGSSSQSPHVSAEFLILIERFCMGVLPATILQEIALGHKEDGGTVKSVDG